MPLKQKDNDTAGQADFIVSVYTLIRHRPHSPTVSGNRLFLLDAVSLLFKGELGTVPSAKQKKDDCLP